jgi:N-succinyldiaminopimelate aminotransferase
MEDAPVISDKLKPFGTTIFSEMTALALEHDAINLSQGFPDFEGPAEMLEAAVDALRSGDNQYARSQGHPKLVNAVARHQERHYGLTFDPMTEVTVFSGATEGIASSMLGLLNPGDEVILFEPFYDSYPACVALAGAVPRYCTLRFPDFALDVDELAGLFTDRTKLLLLNTPHNPTGKVFDENELEAIAALCKQHDVIVLTDEVYEHLVFDGAKHVPMASLPGMRERTLTLSSAGKTFSFTGWKIGWATGPAGLVAAAQAAHQFVTFATATPLQVAVAHALDNLGDDYYDGFIADYDEKRRFLIDTLTRAGLVPAPPRGTYFVLADFTPIHPGDDRAFVRTLIKEKKVAAIPPSVFYKANPEAGQKLVRFAFCKRMETLRAAAERLIIT